MSQTAVWTVRGPVAPSEMGITDGHNHLWLAPVAEAPPGGFVLNNADAITAELRDYLAAGGRSQIDCQPGGCGRDGRMLRRLAETTGVQIVACTGFHLRRYYAPDYWLWSAEADAAYAHFVHELTETLTETEGDPQPVRAGFIKIAFDEDVSAAPADLLDAVAAAARHTGAAIEIHTERGSGAEAIISLFEARGLPAAYLVLCHVDKRPDVAFHRDLCQRGVLLEYDTFFRPKYQPDRNVWPLLEKLVAAGLDSSLVIATDQADPQMWARLGGGAGLAGLLTMIVPRLQTIGFSSDTIARLVGGNIAARLARPLPDSQEV